MFEPSTLLAVVGIIVAAVPAIVGFLTVRAINGVDTSLGALGNKVDALSAQDTLIRIELAKLEIRVMHLELTLKAKS